MGVDGRLMGVFDWKFGTEEFLSVRLGYQRGWAGSQTLGKISRQFWRREAREVI